MRYPPAYVDTARCDHCLREFLEDELQEYAPRYWVCEGCADDLKADEERWQDELEAAE